MEDVDETQVIYAMPRSGLGAGRDPKIAGQAGAVSAALASGYGGLGFVVGFALALGGSLVPLLLAFGECDLALDAAVAEVEADGDEGVSLLLGHALELADLGFVEEQFAGSEGVVVHGVAVGEGADVGVEEEALAVFEEAVGVLEVGFAFADGLDLGAAKGDSGLEFVGEEVIEAGRAVEGGVALAGGDGVAVLLLDSGFGGVGDGRIGERTRHRDL